MPLALSFVAVSEGGWNDPAARQITIEWGKDGYTFIPLGIGMTAEQVAEMFDQAAKLLRGNQS
jgi:hypothetical protein